MADTSSTDSRGGSFGLVSKVVGVVFGAVIAPVLVALAVKYLGPQDKPPEAPAKQDASAASHQVVVKIDPPVPPAAPPPEVKKPLTSGNLVTPSLGDNFYSFNFKQGAHVFARHDPPRSEMFSFTEIPPGKNPLPSVHVSARNTAALLVTKEQFENYDLTLWYRFGNALEKKPGLQHAVLLHCTPGTEGQVGLKVLPQSVAVVLDEGQVGSLHVLGLDGDIKCTATVKAGPGKNQYVYDPGSPAKHLTSTNASWWGGTKEQPKWKPDDWDGTIFRRGYREGATDEAPGTGTGAWTQVRIECSGGNVKVRVGSELTCEITDCTLTRGHIGIASWRSDWYVGKLEVYPHRK